jgi:glycosyltransferase involved in cell wall biosynthesis
MKRILCFFDFNSNTGYGTVTKNIVPLIKRYFGDKIQMDILALNYFGKPYILDDGNTCVMSAAEIGADSKKDDPMDRDRFALLKCLKSGSRDNVPYDGLFVLHDVGMIAPIIEVMEYLKKEMARQTPPIKQFKTILYAPSDSKLIPILVKNFEKLDLVITFTEYARKEMLAVKPELRGKIKIIPHGTNMSDFTPMPKNSDLLDFRESYFGGNTDKKYIITNINRNQPRKDIPSTIFGFMHLKTIWQDKGVAPFLYLHMNPNDPQGWNLRALLAQTPLKEMEDYMLIPMDIENHGATPELLNKIYNASDLYVTTTHGEGWGLTVTEAMACKIPVVAPLNTSINEISKFGTLIYGLEEAYPSCNANDCIVRERVSHEEVGEKMLLAYQERGSKKQRDMVEAAYSHVRTYRWDVAAQNFCEYFESVFGIK